RAAGRAVLAAPALCVSRAALRCRVRIGDLRAGGAAHRARAARVDHRPADARGETLVGFLRRLFLSRPAWLRARPDLVAMGPVADRGLGLLKDVLVRLGGG